MARLRAAGVQVDVGLLGEEAHELNIGFFKRMTHGTPWVRMKAVSYTHLTLPTICSV